MKRILLTVWILSIFPPLGSATAASEHQGRYYKHPRSKQIIVVKRAEKKKTRIKRPRHTHNKRKIAYPKHNVTFVNGQRTASLSVQTPLVKKTAPKKETAPPQETPTTEGPIKMDKAYSIAGAHRYKSQKIRRASITQRVNIGQGTRSRIVTSNQSQKRKTIWYGKQHRRERTPDRRRSRIDYETWEQ